MIDRGAIRAMVEDYWRSFISVAHQEPEIGRETIMRFQERIQATASSMPPDQAQEFLQTVEEERDMLANEYDRNPDALKCRLGLPTDASHQIHVVHRQSLADVAVKTVVRATVWEVIIALFR